MRERAREEGKAQASEAECRGRPEAGLPAGSGGAARGWLYFTDEVGGQIDRKDVFAAFGEVMGLDLDRANANLSEGLNHYNQEMRQKSSTS